MIGGLLCVIVVLVAVLFAVACAFARERTRARADRADRERLERSIRHNVRAIRAHVAYGFPEAVAVCDALESTLQARCGVDAALLENRLIVLRRAYNATFDERRGSKAQGGAT